MGRESGSRGQRARWDHNRRSAYEETRKAMNDASRRSDGGTAFREATEKLRRVMHGER